MAERFFVSRLGWGWALPVLLLSAWLGMRGLNLDTLWYDEWLSVYYAGGAQYGPIAPAEIWARVAERSTWPPGFQTLLAGWGAVAGWDHFAARLFPLLIGVMAVAWMYRLGRDLASARVGLSAAVLLGASAFFANYLHELRGYTMYAFFSALCVWAYWRVVYRRGGWDVQLLLFLSVVGLLYTHYFATLTAVAVAVYHLLFVPKNRAWWRVPILMGGAALLFLPWAGVAFSTARDALLSETRRIIPLRAGEILQALAYSFSNGSVALAALVALFSFAYPRNRRSRRVLIIAWLWVVCTLGIALLANERLRVIFHVRHLMAVWPALALVGALGVEALARRRVPALLVLGLWTIAGLWNALDPAFIASQPGAELGFDWRQFAIVRNVVNDYARDGDALLYHVETPGREWLTEPIVDYYTESLPVDLDHTQLEQIPGLQPNDDYFWQLIDWLDEAPNVWLIAKTDVPSPYHLAEFERVMEADYAHCGAFARTLDYRLDRYVRKPRLRDLPNLPYQFDDPESGQRIGLTPVAPPRLLDGALDLLLGWSVPESVDPYPYAYSVQLIDDDETTVAQVDAPLRPGLFTCHRLTLDRTAFPPGEYRVIVLLRNWQTGGVLAGEADDGPDGRQLRVAQFTVP